MHINITTLYKIWHIYLKYKRYVIKFIYKVESSIWYGDLSYTTTSSSSDIASFFGGGLLIVMLVISLVILISIWKTFKKAGQPGWATLIPIYNTYVLTQIAKLPAYY